MTISLHGWALALTLSTAALSFGCSSSTSSSSSPGETAPTFTEVYNDVMVPNGCSSHHIATGPDDFLDMSTQANAYKNLVGVKADGPKCGTSGLTRVVAGNASESLMYEKVSEAKPPCGGQMPLGCSASSCLSTSDQQEIQNWINAGAMNN
jgi:hypothetical protein